MSQITVEEPKSIVEEVEKYQCDCGCGRIDDEKQFVLQEMQPLDDSSQTSTAHIHKECAKYDEWADYMQTGEKRESLAKVFGRTVKKTPIYVAPFFISLWISSTTIPIQTALLSDGRMGDVLVAGIESIILSMLLLVPLSIVIPTLDFVAKHTVFLEIK